MWLSLASTSFLICTLLPGVIGQYTGPPLNPEFINVPGRCEHISHPEEGNLGNQEYWCNQEVCDEEGKNCAIPLQCFCNGVVTWPVYMHGVNPGDEGYEDLDTMLYKENSYAVSLLPLLDVEACKTDFVLFICPALYQPCYEINTETGEGAPLYERTSLIASSVADGATSPGNFPNEGKARLTTDTTLVLPRGQCMGQCVELFKGPCQEKLKQAADFQNLGSIVIPIPIVHTDFTCPFDNYGGGTPMAAALSRAAPNNFVGYVTYPEEYDGQLIFPEIGNEVEGFGTIPCFDIKVFSEGKCFKTEPPQCTRRGTVRNPYFDQYYECVGDSCEVEDARQCETSTCPEDFNRENGISGCSVACLTQCPSDMFDEDEIQMMWLCFILPALFGLPLNLYAAASYVVGRKKEHKKTPMMLKFSAGLAVLWTLVSVIPSAILHTDVTCTYDVSIQVGASEVCSFLRGTLCILQSMLYWVMCSVIDLHMAVVNGKTPAARNDFHKFYHAWCWGVPLLMYILTYALQERDPEILFRATNADGKYPAFAWNSNKDIFTCTVKFTTVVEEIFILWSHFVIASFLITLVLCSVLIKIGKIYKKQGSTKNKRTGSVGDAGATGCIGSLKAFKKSMDKYGATKLTLLGFSSLTLVVILMIVILSTFPKMDRFVVQYQEEYSCSIQENVLYKGEPCLEESPPSCCYNEFSPVVKGTAPNAQVLGVGYFMSVSLIPFVFGLLFGLDSKHLPVWRRTLGIKGNQVGTSKQSSTASSTA